MKIFVVYRDNTIFGVFQNEEDAKNCQTTERRNLGLSGCMDDRVYITKLVLQ